MNQQALTAMQRARVDLYIEHPFYGVLALRFLLQEDTSRKTAAISHKTIYYNPAWILSLDRTSLKTVIAHELQHCMLDHIDRCNARLPKKWNAACDYVINLNLVTDGFTFTSNNWLLDRKYANMSADHVYTLLPDDHGESMDIMLPGDPADADEATEDWKQAVVSAASQAKLAGKLPASLKRMIDELTSAKVNWRDQLRRFATERTKNDFSWSRPQRRLVPFGHYLPSLYSESMGEMIVCIDTSGSVDDYVLNIFGSEMQAIKSAVRPIQMTNIYCDAAVNQVDVFAEYDELTFSAVGRGGTDFRPPFEYVQQHDLKPACFIYLTDGEGPFPAVPPDYPVLWVMTTDVVAPFGETIRIET